MQIENSTPIPNDSEAVWRVDNKWMLDLNEWMESSIPRTLSDDTHASLTTGTVRKVTCIPLNVKKNLNN
ncbi:hypothetical protein YC2023_048688 [Brassica napus]